jgi:sec-independent protein translocase protein TatB
MLDFAWSEIILLAIVALIFLGPKELCVVLKTLGRFIGHIKAYQRYFHEQLENVSKEDTSIHLDKKQNN